LGIALVAGKKRVPRPPTGKIAFFIVILRVLSSKLHAFLLRFYFWLVCSLNDHKKEEKNAYN
jgi:hypothetical protein